MKRLTILLLAIHFFGVAPSFADVCSGPTYESADCDGQCIQKNCWDVSPGQDGSLFQCCPPGAAAPELPQALSPFLLAIVVIAGALVVRFLKLKKRSV